MGIVIDKLKALKVWNKDIFSNLDWNIILILTMTTLTDIKKWYDDNFFFEESFQLKYNVHVDLERLLYKQDTFWEKRSY